MLTIFLLWAVIWIWEFNMKTLNEDLRENDLNNMVFPMISVDRFEPKTGKKENVVVVGFYTKEQNAAKDLMHFLSGSTIANRDLEVSPNPDENNQYMLFVEIDRDLSTHKNIADLAQEVSRLCEIENWKILPYLSDNDFDLENQDWKQYVIDDPDNYMSREDFDQFLKNQQADQEQQQIKEFFSDSNALDVMLENNVITLKDYMHTVKLTVKQFGQGETVIQESGIQEFAIDYEFEPVLTKQLQSISGNIKVLPIGKKFVFHNPTNNHVLIAEPM